MNAPIDVLIKHFGYNSFRHEQEKIIHEVVKGNDIFALMPTGGGKSLCFQIPALLLEGTAIVFSPLIALMKDQVDALRANGISAAYLNSSISNAEQEAIWEQLRNNELKLLYVAPERLSSGQNFFLRLLKTIQVSLFAIDEAHCISHWGHDFRKDYLFLSQLKKSFPRVPMIALTASADMQTREDILKLLHIQHGQTFIASFNRANISYFIEPKKDMKRSLLSYLNSHREDSGIIYCLSRSTTETMAQKLQNSGYEAMFYHAGMSQEKRAQVQDDFLKDKIKIIVATIAFGMGIDKSNVRFVIHADLPKNIESYYQETGRAGRDGLQSEAILFYSAGDVRKLKSFVLTEENTEQSSIMLKKLQQMADFAESKKCRRQYLMNYFNENHPGNCQSCDYCLSVFANQDITLEAQKLMSAMKRLNERFGGSMVIKFLRGSESDKITPEMKQLKTYGIGHDLSENEWKSVLGHLINLGFIMQSEGQYPVLKLHEKSNNVLFGHEKIRIQQITEKKSAYSHFDDQIHDKVLFAELKKLRNAIAQSEGVPAYIIFSDSTLMELATYLPLNQADIRKISGMGEFKLEKYGMDFLKIIKTHCQNENISTKIHLKIPKKENKAPKSTIKRESTYTESLQYFQTGKSIQYIAMVRGLQENTIMSHLSAFLQSGEIKLEQLVHPEKIVIIKETLDKQGTASIKRIKEALGNGYTYGEIKAVVSGLFPESIINF